MHINDNDDVIFVLDHSSGAARLVMTTLATLGTRGQRMPLWWYQPVSDEALTAIIVWLGEQRALWPAWREISERDGIEAVNTEIRRLWSLTPLETCGSVMMTPCDDQRDIALFAMLVTRNSEIVQHRFESPAHKTAFVKLYLSDISAMAAFLLIEGCLLGPAHLSTLLDDLATSEIAKRKSKTTMRREPKQRRKAA